jgi:hypothetical protein
MKTHSWLLPLAALVSLLHPQLVADNPKLTPRTRPKVELNSLMTAHRSVPEALALAQIEAEEITAARATALAAFVQWMEEDDGEQDDFRWLNLASALAHCGLPEEAMAAAHRIQRPSLRARAEAEASAPISLVGS